MEITSFSLNTLTSSGSDPLAGVWPFHWLLILLWPGSREGGREGWREGGREGGREV